MSELSGSEPKKDYVAELMERLGISGNQLQGVKLGPGVVGRNSTIAWALEIVMLAGVVSGAYLHSPTLVGLSLVGGILGGLGALFLNVSFAKQNPAAAILEGAHFVEYQQMQMTAARGVLSTGVPGPPVPPPQQLPSAGQVSLPEHEE
jgi:hypothetical protein